MRARPTCASTAERGSSNTYKSASAYTALARLILAFCPPEMLMPLSPTSVSSYAGHLLMSSTRRQLSTAVV
eukprot:CAMPEP_0173187016 /NCGR_PEP_ID=MMETSP1141-20130122/10460_1 /TAXON_ID=483371 /ORGANISM="non described non described, Strain CCMP2298" /LENGTH=70 /DNA_ID=CAMNT_0014110777 /DNA_START=174 /DNA_END=386 /DNA_ORIENTATION=+